MCTTDRHAELVALLNKISEESVTTSNVLADMLDLLRERLPGRAEVKVAPFDPDLIARNLDAIKHELETPVGEHGECCDPGEVTEDQRVGTRIVDRDGDVWERREEGWSLWHPSGWGPWRGQGRWPQPPGNGILRPATPADLARVGIDGREDPEVDPPTRERPPAGGMAEALAMDLYHASLAIPPAAKIGSTAWDDVTRQKWLDVARAAREHISRNQPVDVSPLLEREREEQRERAEKAEAERDGWRAKHAALRADVERCRRAHEALPTVLRRDDARDPQAD